MNNIFSDTESLKNLDLCLLNEIPNPNSVMMITPQYYQIRHPINPYMKKHIYNADKEKAFKQWKQLKSVFEDLKIKVHTVPGTSNCDNMVFCANQIFPIPPLNPHQKPLLITSNMWSDYRHHEVKPIENWFKKRGFNSISLHHKYTFESMGDALWFPRKALIIGGYGFRTQYNTYASITKKIGIPIITLELTNEYFYHIDTCLCLLDSKHALVCDKAFKKKGLEIIERLFSKLYYVDEQEASVYFACNACCPDQKHVIVDQGATKTIAWLKEQHFEVIPVDTSEFIKSGGSVFCLKLLFWDDE